MSKKFIPLSVPNLKGNELKYVSNAIESEWVSTAGPYVNEFEERFAKYVHTFGAVSCQSGTTGLHIALILTGLSKDDAVLVPTLTFIAAINPVKYIGASPIFMDCDDSLCIDPVKVEEFCRNECNFIEGRLIDRESKKHIKVLLVVHVFGNMADMVSLMKIAEKYNLTVVEDATEALGTHYTGGIYKGCHAGTIGNIGVYSFNGNKIITTGSGGMIVSNSGDYLKRAKHLTTQAKSNELYFEHDEVGYNYRMTNIQAALGIAQLEQLENFVSIKIENYDFYESAFTKLNGAELLPFRKDTRSNHWFYSLYCKNLQMGRDDIIQYFLENGVQTRPVWGLIHKQIPYREDKTYRIEKAEYYGKYIVNIPCSTNLSRNDQQQVIDLIEQLDLAKIRVAYEK